MGNYSDNDIIFDNDMNSLLDSNKGTGVLTGMAVSPNSGMQLTIASGTFAVNDTKYVYAGGTPTITTADGSNPRKDIITINSAGTITVTAGTPATILPTGNTGRQTYQPKADNIPTDQVILAEVWVNTSVSVINAGDISDLRVYTNIIDGSDIEADVILNTAKHISSFMQQHRQPSKVINVDMTDWSDSYGNGIIADDTSDYPKGDHSVSITTDGLGSFCGIVCTVPTMDISNKILKAYVKVSDWTKVNEVVCLARQGGSQWPQVRLCGMSGYARQDNEWTPLYFSFPQDNTEVGVTSFDDIDQFYFRAVDLAGDPIVVKFGGELEIYDAPVKGSMSIVFDDGYSSVLDAEKILSKYGLTSSIAVIGSGVGTFGYMDLAELHSLQALDWEIISHDTAIYGMSDAERKTALETQRDWMVTNHFMKWGHYILPNGFNCNQLVADLRETGYVSSRTINKFGQSIDAFDPFRINAWSIEQTTTLSDVTDWIDDAMACGSHIVLTLHRIVDTPSDPIEWSKANLESLCEYIVDNDIPIKKYTAFAMGTNIDGVYTLKKIVSPDSNGIKFYASDNITHIGTLDEDGNFLIKGRVLNL